MWQTPNLVNRGVFMELGKSKTDGRCNTPNYTLTVFITCLGYNKSESIFENKEKLWKRQVA